MAKKAGNIRIPLSRRSFLRRASRAAALVGGGVIAARIARAQDAALQSLMEQNQRGEFGLGFDSASRTIPMPKTALPTLSPLTAQTTDQAIRTYAAIVSSGGWPTVPAGERLRLGNRNPAVVPLRQRLAVAGDLGENIGVSDIYDSYVEAAVRRFQARHGLAVDGLMRDQIFAA